MRKNEAVENFRSWLAALDVSIKPSFKVNGLGYNTAIVTVDFGQPKVPVKLSAAQDAELIQRLRALTTSITGRNNVRVQFDNLNGICWSSI